MSSGRYLAEHLRARAVKSALALLALFAFILGAYFLAPKVDNTLPSLQHWRPDWRWRELGSFSVQGLPVRNFEGVRGDEVIRFTEIKSVDADQARKLMLFEQGQLESADRIEHPVDFDSISKIADCPNRLHPEVVRRGEDDVSVRLASNEKFAFGICDPLQATRQALFRYLYCARTRRFFKIQQFVPPAQEAHLAATGSLTCETVEKF